MVVTGDIAELLAEVPKELLAKFDPLGEEGNSSLLDSMKQQTMPDDVVAVSSVEESDEFVCSAIKLASESFCCCFCCCCNCNCCCCCCCCSCNCCSFSEAALIQALTTRACDTISWYNTCKEKNVYTITLFLVHEKIVAEINALMTITITIMMMIMLLLLATTAMMMIMMLTTMSLMMLFAAATSFSYLF